MEIKIDKTKCIGCAACAIACPERFEMDGAYSKVKGKGVECKDCDIKEIIEACPGGAISVE